MSIIAKIAERIVADIPHSIIDGAKEFVIAPNPMAQPLITPNPGIAEMALTMQTSPIPMTLSILSCLALFGLTIWQIRRAITPKKINI